MLAWIAPFSFTIERISLSFLGAGVASASGLGVSGASGASSGSGVFLGAGCYLAITR